MNKRPRDSQRLKVYRAGWKVEDHGERFDDMVDLRAYVHKIFRSKWRKALYRKHNLDEHFHLYIGDGRARRGACMDNGWKRHYEIKFPRTTRRQQTILHEIAHILVEEIFTIGRGQRVAYHGREFCAIMLQLVRRWMGPEQAKMLKTSFKNNKVKHTMPRLDDIIRCPKCGHIMMGVIHV